MTTHNTRMMQRLLSFALILLVLVGVFTLSLKAFHQSALLHKTEQTRDGIDTVRIQFAQKQQRGTGEREIGEKDGEDSLNGISPPHGWSVRKDTLYHPFGGPVTLEQLPASAPPHLIKKPSTRLVLFNFPEDVAKKLAPFFEERNKERRIYSVIVTAAPETSGIVTLDIALATKAGPPQ